MSDGYIVVVKDVCGDKIRYTTYDEPELDEDGIAYTFDTLEGEHVIYNRDSVIFIRSEPIDRVDTSIYDVKEVKNEYNNV